MNPTVYQKRKHWAAILACSCAIWCAVLINESAAQVPDTAELRLLALPVPSVVDQLSALPTSQTVYITGDTFFLELWAQTTAPEGLVQASGDVSYNSASVTAVNITHTAIFDLFPAGSIDNLSGTIDNLSGSHTPVDPPCSDQVGATPLWARVAIVEMRARAASLTSINLLDSNDLFFVIAVCNSLEVVSGTYVGVNIEIQAPQATVSLVARPTASTSDLAVTLPLSQSGIPVGDPFVLEMWAQTDSANGLAQVSVDITYDSALVSAGTITHSALFNLFTTGSVNNFTGTIDNLSGAHPPVIPSCSDSVGTTPNWARVAIVSMSATAVGSLTLQSADANDLIFVMAVCGSEVAPNTTFGGINLAVTLCGNGVTEPGEDCDDGNLLAGDCCSPTCTFESVTTVCRGAVDACDTSEFCDGAGVCPPDSFQPTGTTCGDPTDTTCDAADTCDGNGACLANISPVTTECRAIAGDCDVAEFCDGAGACPVDGFQLTGTACGDPTTSVCDNPNTCDGSGVCNENFALVTVLCRGAVDECDVDDFCDGAGACSTNLFQTTGTPCGDPANTVCDNPDTCDGSGACLENLETVTTSCRSPISDCDVQEFCDGLGRCPIDEFLALGTSCGDPSNTVCDNPDTCDAAGSCLTNPGASTILCRAAASVCDVDDFCDGAGACSVDAFEPAGTACGDPTVTVCDAADACDGTGVCQPNFETTATVCRLATLECDTTEFCDGAGACPADVFEPAGTSCGDPTATTCDNADTCDSNGVCQVNFEPSVTVCRTAVGECDVAEQCDGLGQCAPDAFEPAGIACGDPSNTVCDSPDSCDGTGSCQPNFVSPTISCRVAVDECDAEDFCDGAGSCSPDTFQVFGTPCGDPTATVCDSPDSCDGAGICQLNLLPVTTICRATGGECDLTETCDGFGTCPPDAKKLTQCRDAVDECDQAEFCDGITNTCPADVFVPAGGLCGDPSDSTCDGADTCNGSGLCLSNIEPATTSCRAVAGVCDIEDFCDGVGFCDADAKSTAECRAAVDVCDVAESCDGVLNDCPVNDFAIAGVACGDPSVTICDNADTCDGSGGCQANPAPVTVECRVSVGQCDEVDFCDGAGACSTDAKSTAECRAAADACDVAESCDGVGNNCPVDDFALAGVACGDATVTVCDNADTCDGSGGCLSNPVSSSTLCRSAAGGCDVDDFCNGAGACSADSKSTALCRGAVDECDVDDFCDGINDICPADEFALAGIACGDPTITDCDNADTCDGSGGCLANPALMTVECRASAGQCDEADFCDGAGLCSADAKSTAECRVAVDVCDVAESCDGINDICPVDDFALAGVACGDPTVTNCDNADTCDGAGACQDNFVTDNTPCIDNLFCNGDEVCSAGVCVPGPAVCTDACENCNETVGVCDWCIFDHNLNGTMDGFDFSFFSGCFGVCVAPEDACAPANYDASPDGCVGGSDFGAFSGCFSLTCDTCTGCSGPGASGASGAVASISSMAGVQLVAVNLPNSDDVSNLLPVSRETFMRNERFYLEVWASVTSNSYDGLGSVYVDINYDPLLLELEDIISSDSFSLFSRGTADSSAGLISALGGCAPVGEGSLGSQSTWVRVATLRMRALSAGSTTVAAKSSYGPYGVSVYGRFGDLRFHQIEFGDAELRIQRRSIARPKRNSQWRSSR